MGTGVNKGKYTAIDFTDFASIEAGCVCKKTKYGKTSLTYHHTDHCTDKTIKEDSCKNVHDS